MGDDPTVEVRLALWVRAGSSTDAIRWDPWRHCWAVSCRELPTHGRANRAVATLVASWLDLPSTAVRWTKAGSSHSKVLCIRGISGVEAERRLRSHAEPQPVP